MFGALLPSSGRWAYLTFPLALIFGGLVAAVWALIIAIPSFKTRGDYLAIISLAFMFIVKSLIENLEVVGGPRGLSSQPDWATLPMVFCVVCVGVWIINNFVTSTMGKALNAVRDDESAAEAMTVDTRKTKMAAFLFGAFWAGVAGGLFAHVLRYVNPATFGVQKLAEVLAMVYFGGLNSVYRLHRRRGEHQRARRGPRPLEHSQVDLHPAAAHPGHDLPAHGAVRLPGLQHPQRASEMPPREGEVSHGASRSHQHGPQLRRPARGQRIQPDAGARARSPASSAPTARARPPSSTSSPASTRPPMGRIRFQDQSIRGKRPNEIAAMGLARTFQEMRLWRHMTVLEHVKMARYSKLTYGLIGALFDTPARKRQELEATELAMEYLKIFHVDQFADSAGGQPALRRAAAGGDGPGLVTEPKVLFLDEPTVGMTPEELAG